MVEVTIYSGFGAPRIKSATVFPSICHEGMGPDAMIRTEEIHKGWTNETLTCLSLWTETQVGRV